MSFDAKQLEEHCQTILQSRRIQNKIVILCEGSFAPIKGRRSPQSYGKIEQLPDANFYKACVPRKYNQYLPQFFNCGDRSCVIKTYFGLLELHQEELKKGNTSKSNLNPDKLFAIVDLDNQDKMIEGYPFSSINEIYTKLYIKGKIDQERALEHRIWVTGLIHKESYFIIPELKDFFDTDLNLPCYNSGPVCLDKIYRDMVESICDDADLESHFPIAKGRVSYIFNSEVENKEQFKTFWIQQFNHAENQERKDELIYALLTIKKAKSFWNQIQPPDDDTRSAQSFREQLSLKIARNFYAKKSNNPQYHIPYFIETVQAIAAQSQNEYLIALTQNSD